MLMNQTCKNLRKRKFHRKQFFYCLEFKGPVALEYCKSCSKFHSRANKSIKNKTTKQKKIENERYSIFTNNFSKCFVCQKEDAKMDKHEIYGGSNRKRSIKYGFVVPLCRECHQNPKVIMDLRVEMQKEFEKTNSREKFIEIFGKNYID